jgi:hypothetical protein
MAGGVLLILLGLAFLAGQLLPGMWSWINDFSWPLIVVGVGIFLLIIGILANAPGMAVPACIVGGIGLLLFWQNRTGNWGSWAYAWALIPGFAGVGTVLMGAWEGKWSTVRDGLWLMLISAIMFVIFGALLGGLFGSGWGLLSKWWPVALILMGVLSLIDHMGRRRQVT